MARKYEQEEDYYTVVVLKNGNRFKLCGGMWTTAAARAALAGIPTVDPEDHLDCVMPDGTIQFTIDTGLRTCGWIMVLWSQISHFEMLDRHVPQ